MSRPFFLIVLLALGLIACGEGNASSPGAAEPATPQDNSLITADQVGIASYHDLEALFEKLGYTQQSWQAGVRDVPRIYISEIPPRWSQQTVKGIDVITKKRLFFRVLAPLALRSNELILQDRERLKRVAADSSAREDTRRLSGLDEVQQSWIRGLATRYRVTNLLDGPLAPLTQALLERVDIIPVSLVLSQAAEESGWGTSRFAFAGNALFGQWTWGEGITPKAQRGGKGNYKIASFDSPLESVQAHATNLNSHNAYKEFRETRARARASSALIRGRELAEALSRYSERGADYVKSLQAIIRVNKLDDTDETYLREMKPILLVPTDA